MEKYINILLVEDDQVDAINVRRTLDKLKIFYQLHIAKNGEDALTFLQKEESFTPDVVLVDLNMPKMDGFEFLKAMRRDEKWNDLKAFVITNSNEGVDRKAAAILGVSGYIVKPLKMNDAVSQDGFNLMIDLLNLSAGYPK